MKEFILSYIHGVLDFLSFDIFQYVFFAFLGLWVILTLKKICWST